MGTTTYVDEAAAAYLEAQTGDTIPETHPAPAVPVIITEPVTVTDYPPRTITTDQIPVTAIPARLVTELRTRARLTVRADADVFLGRHGVTLGTGYLLKAGEVFTIDASDELHAVAAAPATVYLFAELREG